MQRAVDQVLTAEGRIDVLINNVGSVLSGPSESTPERDALRQLDVNFVGAMRMTNAVLPAMRSQRSGLILNISSTDATDAKSFESAYQRHCSDEAHGMPPANLAQRVEQIVRRPPTRIRFRQTADPFSQRLLFACRRILSDWAIESLIADMYLRGR